MLIIEPSYEILHCTGDSIRLIEEAGRTCYKSEDNATNGSTVNFISGIIKKGHLSVIEHASLTVKFIIDRGISHELVRHRLAAYSQESTRYCNYSKDKFQNQITVIRPCFWIINSEEMDSWKYAMMQAEKDYFHLLELGAKPQEARTVLPNSLKTEVVMTANFREWRHVLKLRTSNTAHPQIRQVMLPLWDELQSLVPVIFNTL